MAKDMYQKRKERKEKAMSNDNTQQGCQKKCNQLLDIDLWEYVDKTL